MRAAVANVKPGRDVAMRLRGTSQSGVRLYNERLLLSLIRSHGQLPKAEIAKLTGLSAQTVSVIVRQLEAEGLVLKGKTQKGKVGQPLQPFSLNPNGAFSVGLKVGRRSSNLMLAGLDGKVQSSINQPYRFPHPEEVLAFARKGFEGILSSLPGPSRKRIAGLGVAAPFELWKWEEETGAPRDVMDAWKDFDLGGAIEELSPWPTLMCNDATAACAAELFYGHGEQFRNFAYIYVGYFVGGGVVINGSLYQGLKGNAGAIGSLPVPTESGGSEQLIRSASLYLLENDLRHAGLDSTMPWYPGGDWIAAEYTVGKWTERAAKGLAVAASSLASILDCEAVIIDGAMPEFVCEKLVEQVKLEMKGVNLDGISPFEIVKGKIGFDARALGAASLPIFANFLIDRDVLFKETAAAD